ncbi:hypothetical protein KY386_00230 [Candidatus Parcubacteria bacterium]|nr:hypothetical protein [Candidatus Parcubacteria bacterium]
MEARSGWQNSSTVIKITEERLLSHFSAASLYSIFLSSAPFLEAANDILMANKKKEGGASTTE